MTESLSFVDNIKENNTTKYITIPKKTCDALKLDVNSSVTITIKKN